MNHFPTDRTPAFIADAHLGRLAKHLRFAGYDTLFLPKRNGRELLELAKREARCFLSRSARLPDSSALYRIHSDTLHDTLTELIVQFPLLRERYAPFSRCIRCNTLLEPAEMDSLPDTLPPFVREHFDTFRHCPACGRDYWRGSHYRRMDALWRELFRRLRY